MPRWTTADLPYEPPYDAGGVLAFLGKRAIAGIEQVRDGRYERIVDSASGAGWLSIEPRADRPALRLRCTGLASAEAETLAREVRRMFDLDARTRAINRVLGRDPLLAPLVRACRGLRVPRAWSVFEVAIRAVLGQQVSVAAARTQAARIVAQFGRVAPAPAIAGLDHLFPEPEALADADLSRIGLTRARAETVRTVSRAVADGRVPLVAEGSVEDFVAPWVALRGIGDWTAQYLALRGVGHPDAFPAGDLVLRRAVVPGRMVSERVVRERAEPWRPYRAYAVLHLWRATMAKPS
ncbi:MAG TPA: DNA-3-methyladenine glycosylase [Xanthomonadales bacterium]|nr:DNA-3-methyladenine glycosylase [Xanthomonadales bacterium]